MEIKEITVYEKSTKELIAKIFEDGDKIKMIVSDEYEVALETKERNQPKVDLEERLGSIERTIKSIHFVMIAIIVMLIIMQLTTR